jgi:hypothetical protein
MGWWMVDGGCAAMSSFRDKAEEIFSGDLFSFRRVQPWIGDRNPRKRKERGREKGRGEEKGGKEGEGILIGASLLGPCMLCGATGMEREDLRLRLNGKVVAGWLGGWLVGWREDRVRIGIVRWGVGGGGRGGFAWDRRWDLIDGRMGDWGKCHVEDGKNMFRTFRRLLV